MNIRVALAQMNPTVGDLVGNHNKIVAMLKEVRLQGADLVVFPELAVTGYPPEDLLFKKSFIQENTLSVRRLLPHTRELTCLVGFAHPSSGRLYNACAILSDGRLHAVYHKKHLPNYGVFDEKRYFTPGDASLVFLQNGIRIGASLCEDLWVEKGPSLIEAREGGAQILANLSASPYEAGKKKERGKLLSRRSKEASAHLLYVNLVGGQDEVVFDGGSMIFDPQGKCLASAPQFETACLIYDLDIPEKRRRPSQKGAKPKHKIVTVRLPERKVGEKVFLPKAKACSRLGEEEEIYQALVLGTRDYVSKNHFQKVVLGLSGGIDSSLVACIAVDALGKDRVIGVSMPSRYSSNETSRDAKEIASHLGIQWMELSLEPVFRSYLELLSGPFRGEKEGAAEENLQARIRGALLMALSNKFGWLVLTTGNKSEMSAGYCTLYGDMAGGFAVIKDVPKTMVYRLSAYRNREGRIIPESVIQREPTAELRPHQKDSDALPPYETLDPILEAYVEKNLSIAQMRQAGFQESVVREIIRMVDQSEYKRRQGPPGVKITPRAFGKDWRLPITNRYQEGAL
ncbi:MAG: NAD+ synthase [Candidatus Omnitrophota bacterium]